jgi:hypothetical protein
MCVQTLRDALAERLIQTVILRGKGGIDDVRPCLAVPLIG